MDRKHQDHRRLSLSLLIVLLCIAAFLVCVAGDDDATIQWMCETDGSQSPNDLEAQSCAWQSDVFAPCRSCHVSAQKYRESSGVLIMTEEYKCFSSKFEIEKGSFNTKKVTLAETSASGLIVQRLCPGEYSVKGCETSAEDLDMRVSKVKQVIEKIVEIGPDCYEVGVRDESRPQCTLNFPQTVSIELAAHLEQGILVAGRNPATFQTRTVYSCTDLVQFLVQHFVGCNTQNSLGVVSPMSSSFWCQQLDYRPYADEYHPVAADLKGGNRRITYEELLAPKKTADNERRYQHEGRYQHERRYVRPQHPNNRPKKS